MIRFKNVLMLSLEKFFLIIGMISLTGTALAGGSIFGGGSSKASNPQGVHSIGVHICGTLNCPNVIVRQGDCDDLDHAYMTYGVCVCDAGYTSKNGACVSESEEEQGDETATCGNCVPGTYCIDENDTECSECPDEHYCKDDQAIECPAHAECSATDFTCGEGFENGTDSCICTGHSKTFGEGGCWHCDDADIVGPTTEEDCNSCNRIWSEYSCYPKCTDGFYSSPAGCVSCSDDNAYETAKNVCEECSNREIVDGSDFGYCASKCDTGFRDESYRCHSCSEISSVFVLDQEACTTKCPNRELYGKYCILCSVLTKQDYAGCIPSYTLSSEGMTYDQAVAWCTARGQRLATWDELHCIKTEGSVYCDVNLEELYQTPYWITTNSTENWVVGGGGSAWQDIDNNYIARALCVGEPTGTAGNSCSSNSDCNQGYCSYDVSAGEKGQGTCKNLAGSNKHTFNYSDYYVGNITKDFWVSSEKMNWWDAQNYCSALGYSLVSEDTVENLFDCHKSNSCVMGRHKNENYWTGGALTQSYWVNKVFDENYVGGLDDYYDGVYPYETDYYALCE